MVHCYSASSSLTFTPCSLTRVLQFWHRLNTTKNTSSLVFVYWYSIDVKFAEPTSASLALDDLTRPGCLPSWVMDYISQEIFHPVDIMAAVMFPSPRPFETETWRHLHRDSSSWHLLSKPELRRNVSIPFYFETTRIQINQRTNIM